MAKTKSWKKKLEKKLAKKVKPVPGVFLFRVPGKNEDTPDLNFYLNPTYSNPSNIAIVFGRKIVGKAKFLGWGDGQNKVYLIYDISVNNQKLADLLSDYDFIGIQTAGGFVLLEVSDNIKYLGLLKIYDFIVIGKGPDVNKLEFLEKFYSVLDTILV